MEKEKWIKNKKSQNDSTDPNTLTNNLIKLQVLDYLYNNNTSSGSFQFPGPATSAKCLVLLP